MTQTQATAPPPARPARTLDGLEGVPQLPGWNCLDLVGEGAFALVYKARPEHAAPESAPYALKLPRPEFRGDRRAMQLFAREALIGQRVMHPHLLPVLGASLGEPTIFLVLPWLEGATLQAHLSAGRSFDLPEALWIVRQAAEAMVALENAGWTHGDIKPGNLFLSPAGHATLFDLGLARRLDQPRLSSHRELMGTQRYLAPEWRSAEGRADVRADIYGLGLVLWELLGGTSATRIDQDSPPAFHAGDPTAAQWQQVGCYLPPTGRALLRSMLAHDPLRRPQSAAELVAQLAALEIAVFTERAWA